jgi:hypothetical protein
MAANPGAAGTAPTPIWRVVVQAVLFAQSPNSANKMLTFGLFREKVVDSLAVAPENILALPGSS